MSSTLNLGNGNWAVKEDSLLGYNNENGNYKPLPFDFTRASSATVVNKEGLIETVQSGIPRIDFSDDVNGALLAEPQRTNLITYSENFSVVWNITQLNQDFGYSSPSGELTATKFTATNIDPYIQVSLSGVTNLTYSSSVYLKGTASTIGETARLWIIRDGVEYLYEDFTITGDWERISTIKTFSQIPNSYIAFRLDIPNTNVVIGDEVYVWGAQTEAGSYPTSYIPTQGSTVTRVAETCSQTGISSLINSTEGVLFGEIAALANDGTNRRITINDGTISNRLILQYRSISNEIIFYFVVGGSNQCDLVHTLSNATQFNKIALKYKENDFALWVNGVEVSTDTTGNTLSEGTFNNLDFDGGTGNLPFFGKVNQLQVYPSALSDAELTILTTL